MEPAARVRSKQVGENPTDPRYEVIWAPWRLAYVTGQKEPEPEAVPVPPGADPRCFLCQGAVARDRKARLVLHQGQHVVVVLNRYPYNNGHLLVAPRRHVARLDQLTDQEHLACQQMLARLVSLLERLMRAEGFNLGLNLGRVAGAGLPGHLHWHLVPRWHGDTNFMPALAAVRVIPQSLEALWELLDQHLDQPGGQSS